MGGLGEAPPLPVPLGSGLEPPPAPVAVPEALRVGVSEALGEDEPLGVAVEVAEEPPLAVGVGVADTEGVGEGVAVRVRSVGVQAAEPGGEAVPGGQGEQFMADMELE